MSGFDDNVAAMGEWVPGSTSPTTLLTAALEEGKRSRPVLERELSLNHGQIALEEDGAESKDSLQTSSLQLSEETANSRGCLSERIAARAGFNAPKLNTENIRSPCLTISSPGISPATLLESPVFLSNPLAQPSPTTGKCSFFPGGNTRDEFFDDIGASFTFQPVSRSSSSSFIMGTAAKVSPVSDHSFPDMSIDYGNCNRSQTMEGVNPSSRSVETVSFHGNFPGTSAEEDNTEPGERTHDATSAGDDPEEKEQRGYGGGDMVAGGAPADDGYNWRKYGQKLVKGSEYPRSYYKCTHPSCPVKKKVERSREGYITEIIYKGAHNHPRPPPSRRSAFGSSYPALDVQIDGTDQSTVWAATRQPAVGADEIAEGTSPEGNQCGAMQVQGGGAQYESSTFSNDEDEEEHGSGSPGYEGDETESKRRKHNAYAAEMSGATRAIREQRVVVQTTSDVDILDDGYRWRKYGQKVVKGNPNPRSYYKCTAPGCAVRKHVERASHDLKAVITTYEGKHNHEVPAARNSTHAGSGSAPPGLAAAQTHMLQPEPRRRFESPVTVTSHAPFGRPFSFHTPPVFSFGLGRTGLHNLGMPGLAFGQRKLPGFPVHPYLAPQPRVVGEPAGMMLPRATEPKVEPQSETGVDLSESSYIYRQIMGRQRRM